MKPKVILCAITVNYGYLLTKYYYKLPSLGIGYVAAVLENNGYPVSIIDKAISENRIGDLVNEIVDNKPDVVGFYSVSETYKVVMGVLKMIKERLPGVVTMLGGPHVYGLPEQAISYDYIDYCIWGEAEWSFLKLLNCNFNPSEFSSVPGLVYKENGQIRVNPMALVTDLDSLPLPARHLYPPLKLYRPSILAYKRLPATGIITSRGCSNHCIFCHSGKGNFKLRFHSPEYVLEEIKQLKTDYGVRELVVFDDTFLVHQDRVMRICEGIIRGKLDMTWSCNARVNNLNKDLLRMIKRAGCWLVQLGVESGNADILRTIKKQITLEEVEQACKMAYGVGIQVKSYFILGHPNETVETLNDTIKFMTKLPIHYASINYMTPLPGTELWEQAEKYGSIDKNKLEAINYLSDRPAFIPFGLSEDILVGKFKEAYLKFYLNPKTIFRNVMTLSGIEGIKKIFIGFSILFGLITAKLLKNGHAKMGKGYFKNITVRLKLPYEVIKCRLFGVFKPLGIVLYLTDRCNLHCRYCVSHWSGRKIPDLTLDEIKKIIDECKELGTCNFTIHGGEILLRNDVKEVIDYLKKSKFYVNLVTNGILLPEKIDQIMDIDSLCISLDGREENNDFTRGVGSYKATMKAIKIAKEKGLKLNVHATITKRNIEDIEFLAKTAKEIGYYQQFSLLLKPLNNVQKDEIGLNDEESRAVLMQIIKFKKSGYPIFTSYRTLNNALNWPYGYDKARLNKEEFAKNSNLIRCYFGRRKIVIDADGRAYPCSSLTGSFDALNVKEVGVKKAYEHILKNKRCEACFYLTQNDWSLMLGGAMRQFFDQTVIQLREVLNIIKG